MPLPRIILPILAALLLTTGCEEVIEIDLNSAEPLYVIEGLVSDLSVPAEVKISTTKDFTHDNSFEGVTGARVTLSDNAGNSALLAETTPGIYQSNALTGVPGRTYYMEVQIDGSTFTSMSIMPQRVPFDSLYVAKESFPGQDYLMPYAKFRDTPGVKNYYRFRLFVNGVFQKLVDIEHDDYTDGLVVKRGVYYFGSKDNNDPEDDDGLRSGDTVRLEMQCIDKPVFRYFYTLATILSGDAEPANPETNISGGALGYFSAFTSESRELIVE